MRHTVSPRDAVCVEMSSTAAASVPPTGGISSRERVELALSHQEADRVPLDLGGSLVTGMHVSSVYKLRQALGLDPPGTPVKVIEPYQMLGRSSPTWPTRSASTSPASPGSTTPTASPTTIGRSGSAFDGIPMLVPGEFPTEREPNGDILMYPCSGPLARPRARGCRRPASTSTRSSVRSRSTRTASTRADNTEEFAPISDADIAHLAAQVQRLEPTGRAIFADFGGMSFGDIAFVPGPTLRHPKGIRDLEQWYMSLVIAPGLRL